MTKKDYEKFAAMIAAMPNFAPALQTQRIVFADRCADIFAADSSRFNRERFIAACKLDVE